ncbi:hypothetical protein [Bacteroidetes bacterium endosymbiont of Geopemphigus sp.]|uniref:hypothetical protein n=1 Tax=Bacteroidetes bacterium endosymbiont of Geopemphigus sp. TaxID=2047937 RepID=UPI000CD1CB7E|nr:hypothetical protein [Bacteroidetes bacterium endosymbiont of Geopemphigus sp.]
MLCNPFNDSDGNAEIYKLDKPSGNITQSVHLINAKSKDLENIACEVRSLYISDKGNNLSYRKDLAIYKMDTLTAA